MYVVSVDSYKGKHVYERMALVMNIVPLRHFGFEGQA